MCFSASDDTLAPPGQHVVTIWGQWYPYALADGADWDALAETEARAARRRGRPLRPGLRRLGTAAVRPDAAGARARTVPAPWQRHARGDGPGQHVRLPAHACAVRATRSRACPGSTWPAPPPIPAAASRATPGGRRPACCSPTGAAVARPRGWAGRCAAWRPAAAVTGDDGCRRPRAGPHGPGAAAGASRSLLVLTAIAYPLTAGAGRDAVSWTIVVLGSALSVVHASLSRGLPHRRRPRCCWSAVTAVAFEAIGLATGVPVRQLRRTATPSARRCSACRSSCRWPG